MKLSKEEITMAKGSTGTNTGIIINTRKARPEQLSTN